MYVHVLLAYIRTQAVNLHTSFLPWPADCVKPPALEHGSVTFWNTTSGAAAQYECNLGYVLMGSKHSYSKCDGSDWSEPPTCKREIRALQMQ